MWRMPLTRNARAGDVVKAEQRRSLHPLFRTTQPWGTRSWLRSPRSASHRPATTRKHHRQRAPSPQPPPLPTRRQPSIPASSDLTLPKRRGADGQSYLTPKGPSLRRPPEFADPLAVIDDWSSSMLGCTTLRSSAGTRKAALRDVTEGCCKQRGPRPELLALRGPERHCHAVPASLAYDGRDCSPYRRLN